MMTPFDSIGLRRTILNLAYRGSTAHIACAFSIVEILAVLFRSHLRYQNADPRWPGRDYLVLSKGHGVMAQYACMYELGWITDEEITQYFADGSRLKGLADARVPGIEVTAGSLGHGLSVGVGLALAAKRNGSPQRCFVIVGDGEANEGTIWEAMLFAAHAQLRNLTVIVDANGYQAMGRTEEIMNLGSLVEKLRAFGFKAGDVDGHDERALSQSIDEMHRSDHEGPSAIVAKTVKGKGVSFFEGDNRWHYTRLTPETYDRAMAELDGDRLEAA